MNLKYFYKIKSLHCDGHFSLIDASMDPRLCGRPLDLLPHFCQHYDVYFCQEIVGIYPPFIHQQHLQ